MSAVSWQTIAGGVAWYCDLKCHNCAHGGLVCNFVSALLLTQAVETNDDVTWAAAQKMAAAQAEVFVGGHTPSGFFC